MNGRNAITTAIATATAATNKLPFPLSQIQWRLANLNENKRIEREEKKLAKATHA